jgi:alkylation response protein AidB-like acyl-CoA dehydrogenase
MIDLLPNDDQQQIADSVRLFLQDNLPVERLREAKGTPQRIEQNLWAELANLGFFGLSIPDEQGGAGMSVAEEILAFREYGRFLVSPTVLATVLAAQVASARGDTPLLNDLVTGNRRAAILNPLPGAVVGSSCAGEFHLIDAAPTDIAIVWSEAGAGLFRVETLRSVKPLTCIDSTITLARVALDQEQPFIWVPAQERAIWHIAGILIAATLTGMAEAIRDLSVDYAKSREQFGFPIGVFQAVKHKCADMALWAEAAWSQTVWAALELLAARDNVSFQVVNAQMIASETALDSARKAVQIHGGMGFTAEINVHLFLKRAHVYEQLAGQVRNLQQRLLDLPLTV